MWGIPFTFSGEPDTMLRINLTKWLIGAAVVAGTVGLGSGTAEAHWHHGGYGSCGSSGGSWGSYGSSGSWGSCGSSGGYYSYYSSGGCWGSSGGSWGSSGGSWGGSYYSAPVYSTPSAPMAPTAPPTTAPRAPTPPAPGGAFSQPDAGYLLVSVPADAKVFVNGRPTTSTGGERQYVSRGLENGQHYSYEVRAEVVRDGKTVSETKVAQLSAGSQANLSFTLGGTPQTASSSKPPRTALKVNVPADAKVYLSGKETSSTGAVREFSTTTLAEGSSWENYVVRAVSQGVTKEQTVSIKAGESRELTFDFGSAEVASAR
jgi:uncharacterized protein (TIGR03000 family)